MICSLLILNIAVLHHSLSAVNFDYTYGGKNGTEAWGEHYKECNDTHDQSPINIVTKNTFKYNFTGSLKFYDWDHVEYCFVHEDNNGHSVQVVLEDHHRFVSCVDMECTDKKFYLKQLHFHWGSHKHKGSEHSINGKFYDLEMHFVLVDENFRNSTPSDRSKYDWAVIAVLIEYGPENNDLEKILKHLADVEYKNESYHYKPDDGVLDFTKFLPRNHNRFYRYHGSLTSPPCWEVVTWTILEDTITISRAQAERFFHLHSTFKNDSVADRGRLYDNHRPIQSTGQRKVYYRSFKSQVVISIALFPIFMHLLL